MRTEEPYWMTQAIKELGVKELTGNNDGVRVMQYDQLAGFVETGKEPWCANFAGAMLKIAGCDMLGLNPSARSFLNIVTKLKPGDYVYGAVAVLSSSRGPASGHVGFVTAHTKTMVQLTGGNQSNSVRRAWFLKTKIVGLRWPRNTKGLWATPGPILPLSQTITGDTTGKDS